MAEYWKSAPRFWCKQCKIFIRDTPFEKTQHEASAKHQGNLKRFLRDIHRENERKQRETQKAKDEVERLRQTVAGTTPGARDSGDAAPWKRAPAAAAPPPERPVSVEERKRQMAQLAEMGVAIPDEYRSNLALAGEWQTVSERIIRSDGAGVGRAGTSTGVRKRKLEGDEEEQEAKQEAERFVSQGWGSRTRRYPGAQSDADLDALLESTKDIKKAKLSTPEVKCQEKAGEEGIVAVKEPEDTAGPESEPPSIKDEEAPELAASATPAVKHEEGEAATGVVFKKRKPKVLRK